MRPLHFQGGRAHRGGDSEQAGSSGKRPIGEHGAARHRVQGQIDWRRRTLLRVGSQFGSRCLLEVKDESTAAHVSQVGDGAEPHCGMLTVTLRHPLQLLNPKPSPGERPQPLPPKPTTKPSFQGFDSPSKSANTGACSPRHHTKCDLARRAPSVQCGIVASICEV